MKKLRQFIFSSLHNFVTLQIIFPLMKGIAKSVDVLVWPLVAVLIYLALQFMGQFVVQTVEFVTTGKGQPVEDMPSVVGQAMTVSSLLTIVVLIALKQFGLRRAFASLGCSFKNAVLAFVAIVVTIIATNIFNELIDEWFGIKMDEDYQVLFEGMARSNIGMLALCLLGPLCEEIVFRGGIMHPMMERKVRPWMPIVLSSLIFGLAHGNLVQILFAAIVGVVLAIIYYRTGSLLITTIAHVVNNTVTVMMIRTNADYADIRIEDYVGKGPMIVVFILLAASAVMLTRLFWMRTEESFSHPVGDYSEV